MKKFLSVLILAGLLAVPIIALAQQEAPTIIETGEDLINLINKIGNWIFTILLAIAGIMLLWSAFQFITAGGNPETVKYARDKLMYALFGVAVALGAKGLVLLIQTILV